MLRRREWREKERIRKIEETKAQIKKEKKKAAAKGPGYNIKEGGLSHKVGIKREPLKKSESKLTTPNLKEKAMQNSKNTSPTIK